MAQGSACRQCSSAGWTLEAASLPILSWRRLVQIALYTDLPEAARVSVSEVLEAALAYVALGFTSQQPALIQKVGHPLGAAGDGSSCRGIC